jgi:hypothetical protein
LLNVPVAIATRTSNSTSYLPEVARDVMNDNHVVRTLFNTNKDPNSDASGTQKILL